MLKHAATLLFLLIGFQITSSAQVTITPNTDSGCEGTNILLQDIVISETSVNDFDLVGSSRTIIFDATAGTFNNAAGTVTFSQAGVNASIAVTNSQITVTLTETLPGNSTSIDVLTISGIEISVLGTAPQRDDDREWMDRWRDGRHFLRESPSLWKQ